MSEKQKGKITELRIKLEKKNKLIKHYEGLMDDYARQIRELEQENDQLRTRPYFFTYRWPR